MSRRTFHRPTLRQPWANVSATQVSKKMRQADRRRGVARVAPHVGTKMLSAGLLNRLSDRRDHGFGEVARAGGGRGARSASRWARYQATRVASMTPLALTSTIEISGWRVALVFRRVLQTT